jgi:Fe-S oxidoreductase
MEQNCDNCFNSNGKLGICIHSGFCKNYNYWEPDYKTLQQTILSLKSKLEFIKSAENIFENVSLADEGLKEIEKIGL